MYGVHLLGMVLDSELHVVGCYFALPAAAAAAAAVAVAAYAVIKTVLMLEMESECYAVPKPVQSVQNWNSA